MTARAPTTPEEVEALNDRLAREHPIDDYYARSPWVVRVIEQRRLELIRELARVRAGERVLEIGSGGGHVLRQFPQGKLTAVDVSDVFLETARRNLAGYDVTFEKGEVQRLGLPPGSFDCIVCTEVLEHTAAPEEILAEIGRLLAPGGRAVITVPCDPLINGLKRLVLLSPARALLGGRVEWGGDHYHLHEWWPWQMRRTLARWFRVVDQRASPLGAVPLRVCFLCRAAR